MILETISKQRRTEKSNKTSQNVPQFESYSKSHEETLESDLPHQTSKPTKSL